MVAAAKAILIICLLCACAMQMGSTSAIPIWEFLTRNEKMSYLYSTFAQLVSGHCKSTAGSGSALPVNQCKHNLLSYGYEKLQTFNDAQLEALDPYQHDANQLIWSSIMRDHPSATLITTTTRKPLAIPPASSMVILTHQQPQRNPIFESSDESKHKFAMDMDMAYESENMNENEQLPSPSALAGDIAPRTYLTGPLVIRVRPDGTPVEEDRQRPLPRDDDDLGVFQSVASVRPNRHRKIATVAALRQQHFATLALQRELQPPHLVERRHFRQPMTASNAGYFYAKA